MRRTARNAAGCRLIQDTKQPWRRWHVCLDASGSGQAMNGQEAARVGAGGAEEGGCPMVSVCRDRGRPCGVVEGSAQVQGALICLVRGQRVADRFADAPSIRTVQSGLAALCAAQPDGRRQVIALAGPGEVLCSCAAAGLDCWLEALTATVICQVTLRGGPGSLGHEPLLSLLALTRTRLESVLAHVVTLGRLDCRQRMAAFLVNMARRLGREEGHRWHLSLPMTRDDIADYLGLDVDTVTRLLRGMEREGLLQRLPGAELAIPDLEALRSLAPGCPGAARSERHA
jgi:CRP-like cAMP-binding protein